MRFKIGDVIMIKNQYSIHKNLIGQVESIYDKEKKIYRCTIVVNGTSPTTKLVMFTNFAEDELNILNYQPILTHLRDIRRCLKYLNTDKIPDSDDFKFLKEFDESMRILAKRANKFKQKHIETLEKK